MNLRQEMIQAAMSRAGEPYTIGRLAPLLPEDFSLLQIDLDEMALEGEFTEIEAASGSAVAGQEPSASMATPKAEAIDAAERKLANATDALSRAQADVATCQRAEGAAKVTLAQAIRHFQSSFPPVSHEALARDFIRAELERRAKGASGEGAPRHLGVGRSRIDLVRAGARGDTCDDGRGNSGRAVCMNGGGRVYPATARGAFVGRPKS